ncbi:twitching motility protein PilT [Gemmatimonadetes bacterium T265]|nr:twitching motility protein PilT [Gemmatimonadetes bacterium T265]
MSCESGGYSDVHLLLDTHALLWHASDDVQLPPGAKAAIEDPANVIFVSAASAWEIATKTRLGKLIGGRLAMAFVAAVREQGYHVLSVSAQDAQDAGSLPGPHGDPFDRMLAAQALSRGLTLVSNDAVLDRFGVVRLWT